MSRGVFSMLPPVGKSTKSEYDVHPSLAMVRGWVAALPEQTGLGVEAWLERMEREAPADLKGRQAWVKAKTGLGAHAASWLAARSLGVEAAFADEDPATYLRQAPRLVDAMYAGRKAPLRPIFDALVAHARAAFPEARVCPCATMVPFYRTFVFAQVKPTTNTRVDLGLALGAFDAELPDFIIDTGGKAKRDRITHRIALERPDDITSEVRKWLTIAYDLDAPAPPKASK